MSDNEVCCICTESFQNSNQIILSCSHHFHMKCIFEWFGTNKSCPLCRKTFIVSFINNEINLQVLKNINIIAGVIIFIISIIYIIEC
jgi:hypothetical protein